MRKYQTNERIGKREEREEQIKWKKKGPGQKKRDEQR